MNPNEVQQRWGREGADSRGDLRSSGTGRRLRTLVATSLAHVFFTFSSQRFWEFAFQRRRPVEALFFGFLSTTAAKKRDDSSLSCQVVGIFTCLCLFSLPAGKARSFSHFQSATSSGASWLRVFFSTAFFPLRFPSKPRATKRRRFEASGVPSSAPVVPPRQSPGQPALSADFAGGGRQPEPLPRISKFAFARRLGALCLALL